MKYGLLIRIRLLMVCVPVIALIAGCGAASTPHVDHSAVLTTGTVSEHWTLAVDNSDGDLCFTVRGLGSSDGGSCGFYKHNPTDATAGYAATASLDAVHELIFGAAPAATMKVVLVSVAIPADIYTPQPGETPAAQHSSFPSVDPPQTVRPHPLPAWAPRRMWWIATVRIGAWTPSFYDAFGRELTPYQL